MQPKPGRKQSTINTRSPDTEDVTPSSQQAEAPQIWKKRCYEEESSHDLFCLPPGVERGKPM